MNIAICLDEKAWKAKPQNKVDMIQINNRIAACRTIIEEDEAIELIANQGHSFTPAVFKGTQRKQQVFEEMQWFVLDFDSGVSYEKIKSMCQECQLPILFSYYTFSSTSELPRFRIIFRHAVPVQEIETAKIFLNILKEIFQEADRSCFEVSRMFLGGKGLIEKHTGTFFDAENLIYAFHYVMQKRDPNNYKRNLQRFAKRHCLELKNGILKAHTYQSGVKMEELLGRDIGYIISYPQNSSIFVLYKAEVRSAYEHQGDMCEKIKVLEKIRPERLCDICKLCRDFFEGRDLSHGEKLHLALNFMHIKGLKEKFFHVIQDDEHYEKWRFDWDYMRNRNYGISGCNRYCPYAEVCEHGYSIYHTIQQQRAIRRIYQEELFVSVDEAYRQMNDFLLQAVRSPEKAIFLIKAQTGLGKSSAYKKLLREIQSPAIVALPTIQMKNEIAGDLGELAVAARSVKELYMPPELEERVAALYAEGFYKEAKREIAEYAESLECGIERSRYDEYLDLPYVLEKKEKHIIMTHAQFLNLSEIQLSGYTVIIDEDILFTMLRNTKSIPVSEVEKAINVGLIRGKLRTQLESLIQNEKEDYRKIENEMEDSYIKKKQLDDMGIYGNINELFRAGALHYINDTIEFFVPQQLPDRKIIIMSATLDEKMYRTYFWNRKCVFYDVPAAKYQGRLIQYTKYSMSRICINELGQKEDGLDRLFDRLKEIAEGAEYGISFKIYDRQCETTFHFGNAAGTNQFTGKNGMIIGTPHLSENTYKLIGTYLNCSLLGDEATIKRRRIQRNGFEFYFMTYGEPVLKTIQLYMIESELEQCIGRTRLLREHAVVYVFSNYPCKQAELKTEDYLEKVL